MSETNNQFEKLNKLCKVNYVCLGFKLLKKALF